MATQDERRSRTRARLIATARLRFLADGFEAASLVDILGEAGLSKGALYHHFADKAALFEAVYEGAAEDAVERARRSAISTPDPRIRFVEQLLVWLRIVEEPEFSALLFEHGPRVLGGRRARQVEGRVATQALQAALAEMVGPDPRGGHDQDLGVAILNAALSELANRRRAGGASGPDDEATRRVLTALVDALFPAAGV